MLLERFLGFSAQLSNLRLIRLPSCPYHLSLELSIPSPEALLPFDMSSLSSTPKFEHPQTHFVSGCFLSWSFKLCGLLHLSLSH